MNQELNFFILYWRYDEKRSKVGFDGGFYINKTGINAVI